MIPLFKPYMPQNLPELDEILHSGQLAYGKWGRIFEEKLCSYIGIENLLTVNTYQSAIYVVLQTLDLKAGDEVIASPMSCLQSNLPLVTYGLKVHWADINPETGTLDPESVKKELTQKTKLIFHNHFCGYPGYIDEINNIGKEKGIPVIDDCIEAFGSQYKNRKMGNLGTDITIFSFQTVRFPNTIDGGAIIFNDNGLYQKAILCRDLGIDRSKFRDEDGEISPSCDIKLKGYAATMSELNSYLGCVQMDKIELVLSKQKLNAEKWNEYFEKNHPDVELLSHRQNIAPNYWVYGLLVENKLKSIKYFREKGFYASGVHLNNNVYSVFEDKRKLKGVEEFQSKFLAIPCGWWLKK